MFYQVQEIDDIIRCPSCQSRFKDPRIIPCGSSMCSNCIVLLEKKGSKEFKCPVCQESHRTPTNGFFKNVLLAKLVEKQPKIVSRGKRVDDLREKMEDLKNKSNKFDERMRTGEARIKEHCDNIRKKVQLKIEENMQSLKSFAEEFLKGIDAYENECIQNLKQEEDKDKDEIDRIDLTLKESSEICLKWASLFMDYSIDEKHVIAAEAQVQNNLIALEKELIEVKEKIFNGKFLTFSEKVRLSAFDVGELNFENLDTMLVKQLSKTKTLDLSNLLPDICENETNIKLDILENGNILIAYRKTDNTLDILLFDKDLNVIKKTTLENLYSLTNVLKVFSIEQDGSFLFCIYGVSSQSTAGFGSYKFDRSCCKLIICNSSLEPIHQKNIDNHEAIKTLNGRNVDCITAHKQRIYLLSNPISSWFPKKENVQHTVLNIYGPELNLIETHGSSDKKKAFHFPNNINQFEVDEEIFVFLEGGKKIKFMCKTFGRVFKTLTIANASCFFNYMDKYFLTFSESDKKIATYKIKKTENSETPDSLGPKLVNHVPFKSSKQLTLLKCDKEKMYFFDQQNFNLYI